MGSLEQQKVITQINKDLYDAQQKLVALTEKNKKLTSDNRRLKMELSEVTRERDFAQRELINMKSQATQQNIDIAAQRKDNFRQSMLDKFRMAAAASPNQSSP